MIIYDNIIFLYTPIWYPHRIQTYVFSWLMVNSRCWPFTFRSLLGVFRSTNIVYIEQSYWGSGSVFPGVVLGRRAPLDSHKWYHLQMVDTRILGQTWFNLSRFNLYTSIFYIFYSGYIKNQQFYWPQLLWSQLTLFLLVPGAHRGSFWIWRKRSVNSAVSQYMKNIKTCPGRGMYFAVLKLIEPDHGKI